MSMMRQVLHRMLGATLLTLALATATRAEMQSETAVEFARAADVELLQGSFSANHDLAGWRTTTSVALGRIAIDYTPVAFDFQGVARRRTESSAALQLNARRVLNERWTLIAGGGASRGHANFRAIWLDEYFTQQFAGLAGVPGFDTYREATPRSLNLTAGLRWAYRPASGFAQLSVSQLSDRIAPGYEIDFDGLRRGRGTLATSAVNLAFENVLTPRIRSLLDLRGSHTSEREWRVGAEASLNLAVGERWIVRLNAGAADEAPQFTARFAGVGVEWAVHDTLSLTVSGRYYDDTGEIENALLFSSAAPALHSRQLHAGLRWTGGRWSLRLLAGVIDGRYGATNPDTDFFQHLYRDRSWFIGQCAFARSF